MKYGTIFFILTLSCSAEVRTLQVPGSGWHLTIDTPALGHSLEFATRDEGEFSFRGNSDRFNISGFVEKPATPGRTHQECYAHLWALAARNPIIDKASVRYRRMDRYCVVEYKAKVPGSGIVQLNRNYYFVYRDKWVDVHLSIIAPNSEDMAVFTRFERSFLYGADPL